MELDIVYLLYYGVFLSNHHIRFILSPARKVALPASKAAWLPRNGRTAHEIGRQASRTAAWPSPVHV